MLTMTMKKKDIMFHITFSCICKTDVRQDPKIRSGSLQRYGNALSSEGIPIDKPDYDLPTRRALFALFRSSAGLSILVMSAS